MGWKKGELTISLAIFDCLQRDALKDKMQLIGVELHAPGVQLKCRHFKSTFLQPPVEDSKTALLIDQHFQMRAGLIDENKGIALGNLSPQFIKDDAAQQVKPFTHIGLFAVQMVSPMIAQHDQATHASSSLR